MGEKLSTREVTSCRACQCTELQPVLDLGNHYVSEFLLPGDKPKGRAPLALRYCERCGLVQLSHLVDRDLLYRDYYYKSGTNESMVAALRNVVEDALGRVKLESNDYVIDIGANDGTLLGFYPKDIVKVGFEPSAVLAAEAETRADCYVRTDYFPPPSLNVLQPMPAKIITSIAMFYDLDDPAAFVRGIKEWLHPEGVWILQMPDLWQMIAKNAFDNICHEHVCYWPTRTLYRFLLRHGLRIVQMTNVDVNGGSLRYIIKHAPAQEWEEYSHSDYDKAIRAFGERITELKHDTKRLIRTLQRHGKRIWGYGASTKGNTLLQFYGIGTGLVEAIAERNPRKWGRRTVGTNIPIVPEETMRQARPDYLLVLPWHFLPSFREREATWEAGGGQWIVPLPDLKVIGG